MIKRPFRFAITGRGRTGPEFRDFARKAEDLGYDTMAFPDHLPPPNVQLSPLLAIAAASQVTKTIRFTTTTLANDFRHPAFLAKEVAMLDMLTEGRYEMGIGTGSNDGDNHMAGIAVDPPGKKVERLQETLAIVKAYFSQETVNFAGKHYTITDLPGYPNPVAPLKVLVGAAGPRMLRLAGREADIVSVLRTTDDGAPGESLGDKIAIVRKAAGEQADEIEYNRFYSRVQVDGVPATTTRLGGNNNAAGLVGSLAEVCEHLERQRELYGVSYIFGVGEGSIDALAPVVAKLRGR
jgi:probable F420-dependent oxidoreductase